MAKTKELKKRALGNSESVFVRFGSRLPCERLSFQRASDWNRYERGSRASNPG